MSRVAIIGGGVSGLTSAYLLSSQHEVTVFEADDRLGGHSHTHTVRDPQGELRIDSGFIVHNDRTYPNLLRLFKELGIATQDTEMSMSISCRGCSLEYAGGRGGKGVFADPLNLFNIKYLKLLKAVKRFHKEATVLLEAEDSDLTWGEFLQQHKFDDYFVSHYAIPVVACVWSASHEIALQYPAKYLFTFLRNHGMLSIGNSPTWRTVIGGSNTYVDALRSTIEFRGAKVLLNAAVTAASQPTVDSPGSLTLADGSTHEYDKLIIATHADIASKILIGGSDREREALSAFEYSTNVTSLHTDPWVLPNATQARSSWNYRIESCNERSEHVQVSYWMNRLQNLPAERDYLVTLNSDTSQVRADSVIATMTYQHPIFTNASVAAAAVLRESSTSTFAWAGAHLGWGFHEDGCRSGVEAAEALGGAW